MGLFSVLLIVILSILFGQGSVSPKELVQTGEFTWSGGINLIFVALIQCFSYPFHDPVMTDRGFISSTKTTLWSFILAGIIGAICIFLFSFLGIYGKAIGLETNSLVKIASVFGPVLLILLNFIMIVSAASTLDSTFASFSKLAAIDLKLGSSVRFGRLTMIFVAIAGTIPVFFNPAILSATTISGTMVIGLTPVFLFWWIKAPPISFYLSVLTGITIGLLFTFNLIPKQFIFTDGPYNSLLWSNVFGVMLCVLVYFMPVLKLNFDERKNTIIR